MLGIEYDILVGVGVGVRVVGVTVVKNLKLEVDDIRLGIEFEVVITAVVLRFEPLVARIELVEDSHELAEVLVCTPS